MFYSGIVENRSDPLQLGRCQVRIVGLHTHDKSQLPTNELPWALPVQPIGSAAMNGIGYTPIGPVEGTTVIIMFADENQQQPIILGTVGGIPQLPTAIDDDDNSTVIGEDTPASKIELRTIPGPVNGKQLTFYDKETGRTDLTKDLRANMGVVGFQLPDNTFIVSIDSGTQITINNEVAGYGENIITFKEPPTNLAEVNASKAQNYLTDSSGKPVTSSDGKPITVGETPVQQTATNTSIPTKPPKGASSNPTKSEEGIKALIAACDKVGLTTKEQKCALLGIAGGESRWIPQNEAYNYSKGRIKQIFSFLTDEEADRLSDASKKGITREQFFTIIYGPTKRGKNFLGNQTDADGGKYYGRGFIQLTGRGNYKKYQDMANKLGLNLDLVNNPDSLDADINVSALVAALYIKDRVPSTARSTDHPGYFYAAKKAVGVNSPDIAAKKLEYYEYFYGSPSVSTTDKDAAAPQASPPSDGSSPTPGPSPESKRRGSDNTGFRDPNNKYPLKDYLNEPDTNRLARGIITGTVIEKKDVTVKRGVPKAYDEGFWDQPSNGFGAKYPFNKVMETESGHVQEWDDTPGHERIHTYHRSGTFSEIDANGTKVNYIVGDNFTIMERNGSIHVAGEYNLTADGNANIFCRTDANIEVSQNANVRIGNNASIGVANDLDIVTGGDFNVRAIGDFNLQAANINQLADKAMKLGSSGTMDINSSGVTNMNYSKGNFGVSASMPDGVDNTPPDVGSPMNPNIPYLPPPDRQIEEKAAAETPEDYDTPEGRKQSNTQTQQGVPNAPAPVTSEEATPSGGVQAKDVPTDCKIIYTTKNFTNDYTISKNFTLGMLISQGGVTGPHKLIDQMLEPTKGAPPRLYTAQEIVCNLAMSAQNILEPYLQELPNGISGYGKLWTVSSGYRLRGVVPYESPVSDHCKGHCFDVCLLGDDRNNRTYDLVQKLERLVKYDQIILEYRNPSTVWIHTGYKSEGNRNMAFTMLNDAVYKRDSKGIPSGFVLLQAPVPPKNKPQ
jgi:predicted chitinase